MVYDAIAQASLPFLYQNDSKKVGIKLKQHNLKSYIKFNVIYFVIIIIIKL